MWVYTVCEGLSVPILRVITAYWLYHLKMSLMAYSDSEITDHPVYLRSFIGNFAVKEDIQVRPWEKGSLGQILQDQSNCMDAQIRAFTVPSRPRWLSWIRRPTGDQEVAGSTPAEVGNILSWRLIIKYFLRSFSPFR